MKARWVVHAGAAAAVIAASVLSLAPRPAPTASVSAPFDCQPGPLSRIQPGTRIADGPPPGWTYLVSKSQAELASGDVDKLHARAADLASLLFTAYVARVDRQETDRGPIYRLESLANGVGTRVGDADVILSSKNQSEVGADLDFLQRCALARAEKELDRPVRLARSDTSLLVDMPTVMLIDGKHRSVIHRYLFMVHPREGRLEAVLWRIDIDAEGQYRLANLPAVRYHLGRVAKCPLHVDANETFAGVPTSMAFATVRMPAGDPLPLPRSLQEIAGQRELTPTIAEQIDTAIRRAIGFLSE